MRPPPGSLPRFSTVQSLTYSELRGHLRINDPHSSLGKASSMADWALKAKAGAPLTLRALSGFVL